MLAVSVIFCIASVSAGDVNQTSVVADSDAQVLEHVDVENLEVDENTNVKQASEKQTLAVSDDGNSTATTTGTVSTDKATAKKPIKLSIKVKKTEGDCSFSSKRTKN